MISSHEEKLRKLLNLRSDDRPSTLAKDAPWPPAIPADLAEIVSDAEQLTRNHRGNRQGVSVELTWDSLICLVAMYRSQHREKKAGVCAPPATDAVKADEGIMALRKKVQEKTGKKWEELMQANRAKLEEWLNG